jgi:hypothetical protein
VTPQLVIALGAAVLAVGVALLQTFGPRYRVGRLFASAPLVPIGEAVRIARAGERRFVRIDGRIDSDAEFEDADHQPLVLRRTRFESRSRGPFGRWRTFDQQTEAVPFELHEGLDAIGIDRAGIGDGLIVVPRRSVGVVGDLGDRAPTGEAALAPNLPARVTIEQVSSVEHAIVQGFPALDPEGAPVMTAGRGRPLILTTLEVPEAMRILTGGAQGRARAAAASLAIGGSLLLVGLAWLVVATWADPVSALAASPLPSILPGSDTRSSGEGPGLVGNPALALFGVLGIAVVAILATLAYVRVTAPPGKH